MCKIFTFTNSKQLDVAKVAEVVAEELSQYERDGFGYAVQGVKGVFGEKSIDDTFKSRIGVKNLNPMTAIDLKQETFGEKSKPIGPMICHGRTSTNDKGLTNCHPMQRDGFHLIHNGVVTDHGPKYEKSTTNDSEDLLHRFIDSIDSVEKHLTGYYAFTCITPDGRLHIVRDRIAPLHISWVSALDTYVISTKPGLIESVCKALKVKAGPIDSLKADTYLIYSGNDLEYQTEISSRGYDDREAALASKSLGRTLDSLAPSVNEITANDLEYLDGYEYEDSAYDYLDSMSEESFEREVSQIDDTYHIYLDNTQLTASEFRSLDPISQRRCEILRQDGSMLEYFRNAA